MLVTNVNESGRSHSNQRVLACLRTKTAAESSAAYDVLPSASTLSDS